MARVQRLDGSWLLAVDPTNAGQSMGWSEQASSDARPAPVPGIIQQIYPDYHGVAWYWHDFRPIRAVEGPERALLCFGSVDYMADVWLNGVPVGSHEGGEAPFTLDVTAALRHDDNILAVRVLNPTDEPIDGIRLQETPHMNKFVKGFQPGCMYDYGGILLPVELQIAPAVRIRDVFARLDPATGTARLEITVRNDTSEESTGRLIAAIGPSLTADVDDSATTAMTCAPGETTHQLSLSVARPRLWDLNDPYLYRVTVALDAAAANGATFADTQVVRCGFRDFRVADGYFRLNGRRIFLRSTHTGNHYPVGQVVPIDHDFLRRDLVYAKAAGFNTIRFIGRAWPEQLDFCDEIGLLVYEETMAGWLLEDSPQMAARYDSTVQGMVLRDRNHPCLAIWGMLNETFDGPVFRQAVEALALVRSLDDTRLVLLNSGRFDAQPGIGSVSNPGSTEWEHVWGSEAPGAQPVSKNWAPHPGYIAGAGDAHAYPSVPHLPAVTPFMRTLGRDTKPVFLSEYGIGSLFNAIREYQLYEQNGGWTGAPDAVYIRSFVDRLIADWDRFAMDGVYAFPEDMLRDSQRLHARQRLFGFDLVRSNPKICGYNLTGMLDHALTGEGLWTFWREWKPGIMDVLADGWAPLRWCVFCDPPHGYAGSPFTIDVVLANEDVLAPGTYPVRLRIVGPHGVAWEKRTTVCIPQPEAGQDGPLAVPVLSEEVSIDGPGGVYEIAVTMERGGAPAGGRLKFHVAPAATPPQGSAVTQWGIDDRIVAWLQTRGIACQLFEPGTIDRTEVILVGDLSTGPENAAGWRELARRIASGSTAIFLSPLAFKRGDNPVGWLPLVNKGQCFTFRDMLYHKECVAKAHPIFDGLQPKGVMDWDYYGPIFSRYMIDGQDHCYDVAAAGFAVGINCPGGYAAGLLVGSYPYGSGHFMLNTLQILEHIDRHPAADRLLTNMITYAGHQASQERAPLPDDFEHLLTQIGYH